MENTQTRYIYTRDDVMAYLRKSEQRASNTIIATLKGLLFLLSCLGLNCQEELITCTAVHRSSSSSFPSNNYFK